MPRAERNRNLFASAIAGSTSSGSTTSRRTRLETNPFEPYLVEEERATTTTRTETNSINRLIRKFELFEKKMDSLLNDNADIKKRLKNIELLTEINNDPDFSKDVINRVAKNIFKANIFPSTKDLVDETEHVIRKNFPDISESMNLRHHSKLFKRIKAKGGIASRVKLAIFEIFGESQLPRIDFQSSPAEINSWKSDQRVKDAYRKLFDVFSEDRTYVQGVAIAQLFLNPDVKEIMISENLLKKQIKINFRKLQQKRSLRPEEGELDVEETSEEESEEEEEEGKSHVPSSGRAPSPGRISPPLTSPSRLLPEFFDNEDEGRQRARKGRRESRRQHSQEGWRESRQRSREEEGDTTGGDTERAEIVAEQ
ncbi:hypothetical protein Glove_130g76 [Diversispora epigaea]|uniref:Uncharacterized protein n=1 Tax=Diversispora epigaea TaxID=1348612 RepID=A0A397J873_9GLOM|nr:hypothetical protein Glove_130g76 [Diversispora epigaea]